jgi:hypothetical protein
VGISVDEGVKVGVGVLVEVGKGVFVGLGVGVCVGRLVCVKVGVNVPVCLQAQVRGSLSLPNQSPPNTMKTQATHKKHITKQAANHLVR